MSWREVNKVEQRKRFVLRIINGERMSDLCREYCYPLTLSDHYSRYILACEALESIRQEGVYEVFQHHGVPKMIRSDNGSPFVCTHAIYGLTKLSVWLLGLGIRLERIEPGHPEQNGRHERMHRTLKEETTRPPAKNILSQQEKLDKFIQIFNHERPHEALDQKTPASQYHSDSYPYQSKSQLEYPLHDCVRKVHKNGTIKIKSHVTSTISTAFAGQNLGLRELETKWLVSYANYDIGYIFKDSMKFESFEYLEA